MTETRILSETCGVLHRSLHATDIPYMTDDADKLKYKLAQHFEKFNDNKVERVICPFGGTLREAVIILAGTAADCSPGSSGKIDTALLPPVFCRVDGTLEQFYWNKIPLNKAKQLTERITSMIPKPEHVTITKKYVTDVVCSWDQVESIASLIIDTGILGRNTPEEALSSLEFVAHGVLLKDLPYLYDDVKKLKSELEDYFKTGGFNVKHLICGIKGEMTKAIVVFSTPEERAVVLKKHDIQFHGQEFVIEELPPVYTQLTGTVDEFYTSHLPRDTLKHMHNTMKKRFGHSFGIAGDKLTGTLDQILGAVNILLETISLQEERHDIHKGAQGNTDTDIEGEENTEEIAQSNLDRFEREKSTLGESENPEQKRTLLTDKNQGAGGKVDLDITSKSSSHEPGSTSGKEETSDDNALDFVIVERNGSSIVSRPAAEKTEQREMKSGSEDNDGSSIDERRKPKKAGGFKSDRRNTGMDEQISTPSATSETCSDGFLQVDMTVFEYVKNNFKSDLGKIETKYKVKLKTKTPNTSKPFDQVLEIKFGKKQTLTSEELLQAKTDFITLYSSTLPDIHTMSLDCRGVERRKIKKATDMIKKKFPTVTFVSNEEQVAFCASGSIVNDAVEEFQITAGMCTEQLEHDDALSVDHIVFEYITEHCKDQLDNFESKFNVAISVQATSDQSGIQRVSLQPKMVGKQKQKLSPSNIKEAKDEFITLYQGLFYTIKKVQISCSEVQKELIKRAIQCTKQKYKNVNIVFVDTVNVVLCSDEETIESAVQEFRTIAGLLLHRKLRKNVDSEADSATTSSPGEGISRSTLQTANLGYAHSSELLYTFTTQENLELIVLNDNLTKQQVNCIVNSANGQLNHTLGVAKALSSAAGPNLQRDCRAIMKRRNGKEFATSEVVVTDAHNLPCDFVAHAVAPLYNKDKQTFIINLTKTFMNALEHAEKELQVKTIAIPLIGSGNSTGPKDTCTKALGTALLNFSKTRQSKYLRQVFLVNIDKEATRAIQTTFSEMFPRRPETTNIVPTDKKELQSTLITDEGLEVLIAKSNITTVKATVIVNAANGQLKHSKGVAGALSKSAGAGLQEESNRLIRLRGRPFEVGDVVATDSYSLPCDKVLHAIGPRYKEDTSDEIFYKTLQHTYLEVLKHANVPLEARTVALPLISSGIFGGPKQLCANALATAVLKFSQQEKNRVIKTLHLVNIDNESTQALQAAFQDVFVDKTKTLEVATEAQEDTEQVLGLDYYTEEGIEVCIVEGEITNQHVDVMIHPTDTNLWLSSDASKAVSKAAGDGLKKELDRIRSERSFKPLKTHEIVKTNGYDLPCLHILHTTDERFSSISPSSSKKIFDAVYQRILTCLKYANTINIETVALPLIGSGRSGGQADVCAVALAKALQKVSSDEHPLSFKRVVIATADSDETLAVQLCLSDEFGKYSTETGSPGVRSKDVDKRFTRVYIANGKLPIGVKRGAISQQEADVIVNFTDERVQNTKGVSKQLSQRAGKHFQAECNSIIKTRKADLKPGEYIATDGYDLPCRKVVHVSLQSSDSTSKHNRNPSDFLRSTILNVLLYSANTLKAKKVVLPLVTYGCEDITRQVSIRLLVDGLQRFININNQVSAIVFVDHNEEMLADIIAAFSRAFTPVRHVEDIQQFNKEALMIFQKDAEFSDVQRHSHSQLFDQDTDSTNANTKSYSGQASHGSVKGGNNMHNAQVQQLPSSSYQRATNTSLRVHTGTGQNTDTTTTCQSQHQHIGDTKEAPNISVACQLCDNLNDVSTLEGCGHVFCHNCYLKKVIPPSKCPKCKTLYCVVQEEKNNGGTMTYFIRSDLDLQGEAQRGTLVIRYDIPAGKQGPNDPQPQAGYYGTSITTFLPNIQEAYEVVLLLAKAFAMGLTFSIQKAPLDPCAFEAVLSDTIPHKKSTKGGPYRNGYPDPGFTSRVKQSLHDLGVRLSSGNSAETPV